MSNKIDREEFLQKLQEDPEIDDEVIAFLLQAIEKRQGEQEQSKEAAERYIESMLTAFKENNIKYIELDRDSDGIALLLVFEGDHFNPRMHLRVDTSDSTCTLRISVMKCNPVFKMPLSELLVTFNSKYAFGSFGITDDEIVYDYVFLFTDEDFNFKNMNFIMRACAHTAD